METTVYEKGHFDQLYSKAPGSSPDKIPLRVKTPEDNCAKKSNIRKRKTKRGEADARKYLAQLERPQ